MNEPKTVQEILKVVVDFDWGLGFLSCRIISQNQVVLVRVWKIEEGKKAAAKVRLQVSLLVSSSTIHIRLLFHLRSLRCSIVDICINSCFWTKSQDILCYRQTVNWYEKLQKSTI